MSPRRTILVVALLSGLPVASACGPPSDSAAGSVTTVVRSEPVSGRPDSMVRSTKPPSVARPDTDVTAEPAEAQGVVTGAEALIGDGLTPLLGRRVGLIANRPPPSAMSASSTSSTTTPTSSW